MFTKCSVCGKSVFTLFKPVTTCPKCGSNLSVTIKARPKAADNGIQFPQRENASWEDGLKRQLAESYEGGGIGRSTIFGSWEEMLGRRRLDAPFYTALKKRACILVHFSSQSLGSEEQLEELLNSGLGFPMQVETFLKGSFPVIRCNLVIPDDPANPFCLEAPLNICDGDVQEFIQAVLADEYIDLILKHEESRVGKYYAVECHAPGLSTVVEREVRKALRSLKPTNTRENFRESIKVMETAFPSAIHGVGPEKCIILRVTGKARNESIWYGDE